MSRFTPRARTVALTTLIAVLGIVLVHPSTAAAQKPTVSTGRFDLSVDRSTVLRAGKSHVETKSAFAVYNAKFFAGRISGLEVHLYASPIDARARERLLANPRDDQQLLAGGAAYFIFLLDRESRITQANLTIVVPGTTVARTVAYTTADIAKWFSDYHYVSGRLHLNSKGAYASTADSKDEKLSMAWDVTLDLPVVESNVDVVQKKIDELKAAGPVQRALDDSVMRELGVSNVGMRERRGVSGVVFENWKKTDLSVEFLLPIARQAVQVFANHHKPKTPTDTVFVQFVDYKPECATFVWIRKPVTQPPDRFIRTKAGTPCKPPYS